MVSGAEFETDVALLFIIRVRAFNLVSMLAVPGIVWGRAYMARREFAYTGR